MDLRNTNSLCKFLNELQFQRQRQNLLFIYRDYVLSCLRNSIMIIQVMNQIQILFSNGVFMNSEFIMMLHKNNTRITKFQTRKMRETLCPRNVCNVILKMLGHQPKCISLKRHRKEKQQTK